MADFTQEQLDTAVAAAVTKANETSAAAALAATTASDGLTTKNTQLLDELKTIKASSKRFEGLDVEELQALKAKIEGDDILALHADGKHSEAYDKMMEKERVTHTATLETLNTELETAKAAGVKDRTLVESLLIDGGAKAALIAAKGLPEAADDIAMRARQVWTVEEGVVVARDDKGELIAGEKGPLTMGEWAEGMKKIAPHFFPASETAGAGGADGDTTGAAGDLDSQILAASAAGDFGKMRELNTKKRAGSGHRR